MRIGKSRLAFTTLVVLMGMNVGVRADETPTARPDLAFERVKNLVFPLRTSVDAAAAKRSYGTAFVVDPSGVLATNFHVVSDAVRKPEDYRLFLEMPGPTGTQTIPVSVLVFDVVHDLALVKAERTFDGSFALIDEGAAIPSTGERLWSIGKPLDLSMSLVEGNFAGEIRIGDYARYFISTPINPGMSGGPTIDVTGAVRGVNVAIYRDSQNVSFAVPGRFLSQLLQKWRSSPEVWAARSALAPSERKAKDKEDAASQIAQAGDALVAEFVGADASGSGTRISMVNGRWRIPLLPSDLKCWQDRDKLGKSGENKGATDREKDLMRTIFPKSLVLDQIQCATQFRVPWGEKSSLGAIRLTVDGLGGAKMAAPPDRETWKSAAAGVHLLATEMFSSSDGLPGSLEATGDDGDSLAAKSLCRTTVYEDGGSAGQELEAVICLSAYKDLPSLYQLELRVLGGHRAGEVVLLGLRAEGFALSALRRLTEHWLSGVKPADGSEGEAPMRVPAAAHDDGMQAPESAQERGGS